MIPTASPQQLVLVLLFNFLFNGRMLNSEKQIKIFLLNISFQAGPMRGLKHDTHAQGLMWNTKSLIRPTACQISRIQSYKYGNHNINYYNRGWEILKSTL